MKSDIDPDVFLSEVFQLRYELNDFDEVITDERLTTIILDALPEEMYSTVKIQSMKYSDLGLEEIIGMMKTIFVNHSEKRWSVAKTSQESYRKFRNSYPVLPEMALAILWKTTRLSLAHIISDCFDAEGGTSRSTTLCCVCAPSFVTRDRFCASISKKVSTAKVHA